jgi:hypothetical protein
MEMPRAWTETALARRIGLALLVGGRSSKPLRRDVSHWPWGPGTTSPSARRGDWPITWISTRPNLRLLPCREPSRKTTAKFQRGLMSGIYGIKSLPELVKPE